MDADVAERTEIDPAEMLGLQLEMRYRHIHATAMQNVPLCNPALGSAATGFRICGGRALGIVTTPWFMNLAAVDIAGGVQSAPVASGTSVRICLPAGEVEFIAGELDAIGRVDSCSLFSPAFEFETMEAALETAMEAVRAFFDPAALEPAAAPPASVNRRDLLWGNFRKQQELAE
ncbi:[NiFe]-hydrogenase assembly chaperone HybE [Rhizobium sp. SEMIA 4085]|uniref:Hydrogenase expression/formation protein HupJ n=1 Tax=Rhizobium gallicum bv. gallicum R602sp TaxID=1041138 RepID=A0A0B4XAQ2_9HYPH|nr:MULTISPECIES: [NiFe]-hydrogenase assembly chaperone HybE [Rhizobium]AJD43612.1 hydrogenase expression/formation protein HupJ [Rhizobium gallicum bv. gallicum R602sp]NNH28765.1 [NiFe]-hydrogenase assembly chaperone HybE [Rhizobium sp. SEMIA 4085]TDW34108.1 [NiFe] hydrogenase assembly HybE family chaperone [Rhizobium azibense]